MKRLGLSLVLLFIFGACSREENHEEKVLNLIGTAKVKGFDPIFSSDLYSNNEVGKVYEGLLEFHYLRRPYELIPNLADALPVVSEDNLTYTFKLKKGVMFHESPCFGDKKSREMKADDVVYSLKRLADPKLQSTGWWLLDGKLAGLNEWRDKYAKEAAVNYDDVVEGLKKIDDYTVQFKLTKPFPQFLYALAMPFTSVVPKEAVVHFGNEFLNYPVGTGPFMLDKFDQSNRIVYHRNPKFREKLYPSDGEEGDDQKGLLADAGKKLPLVDKIVVDIQIEAQPQWLNFQAGKADYLAIPKDNFDQALVGGKELAPDLLKKGMKLFIEPNLDVTYIAFNNEDPIFKNNPKLRQAMSMAYNRDLSNKRFYNNTAVNANSIIPPGIAGHKKDFKSPYTVYDVEGAKKLLKEAGFPEGKGLPTLTLETINSTVARQQGEFFIWMILVLK
jgi:oligopeptide transport system substrate-binding protein